MVLDNLEYFQATSADTPITRKVDRAGRGRILLRYSLGYWMDNGIRTWWMINRNNSIIKKGLKMGQSLLHAVNDQG